MIRQIILNNKKKSFTLFTFVLLFIISSCGGSGTDTQNYQDPALMNYKINTVAVLPMRNSYFGLSETKEVNRYFMTGISRKVTGYTIIGPDDAIEKINKDSLVEQYYKYLVTYSTTGIPNTEICKKVCTSIGCDLLIQGEVYNISKIDGRYGRNKGETRCSVRYSAITAIDGKIVWETTTEAYEKTTTTLEDAPALMDVIKVGMDDIIESMPNIKKK